MRHSPLVIWPLLDPAMWRWGLSMLANCTEKRLCAQQEPHGADRRIQPRLHEGAARRHRHPLRRPREGTLQLFRTQAQLDGTAKDIEILEQYKVPYELLDREGFVKVEPALALTKEKFVGALRLPGDETGDCFKFTNRLAEMATTLGARLSPGHDDPRLRAAGRPDHRCAHRCRRATCRPLCGGAGQLYAVAAQAHRHAHPGLSGQGLFDHRADHRREVRARIDHHGRDTQGGGDAPGRPHPRRRHGRAGRLQPGLARGAPRHAEPCGHRSVPEGRRRRPRPASGAACGR